MQRNESATTVVATTRRYESRASYGEIIKPSLKPPAKKVFAVLHGDHTPAQYAVESKRRFAKRPPNHTTYFWPEEHQSEGTANQRPCVRGSG